MTGSASHPRVLLIFLDGVGIGDPAPEYNPFFAAPQPFLSFLTNGTLPETTSPIVSTPQASIVPLDATLGVEGLPQSGTGQTALFTGMNAARRVGRHFGPYVYSTLKPMLTQFGIFQRLQRMGWDRNEIALANAFPQRFFDYLAGSRRRMVAGMYMTYTAGIPFRDIRFLQQGEAVSTDITAKRWKEIGHPEAPVLPAYDAGKQLAHVAASYRFTLFEYFRTDTPGHDQDMESAIATLSDTDAFLHGVFDAIPEDILVLVTSDHGNIEDLRTKSHTRNSVPLIVFGKKHSDFALRCSSIMDITPEIIRVLTSHPPS